MGGPTARCVATLHSRARKWLSVVASSRPLGVNATPSIAFAPGAMATPTWRRVPTAHRRARPPMPPVASRRPFGWNATLLPDAADLERPARLPVSSHAPQPDRAIRVGHGHQPAVRLNATSSTWPCTRMGPPSWRRVARVHRRAVPSVSAVATSRPPGLNAASSGQSWGPPRGDPARPSRLRAPSRPRPIPSPANDPAIRTASTAPPDHSPPTPAPAFRPLLWTHRANLSRWARPPLPDCYSRLNQVRCAEAGPGPRAAPQPGRSATRPGRRPGWQQAPAERARRRVRGLQRLGRADPYAQRLLGGHHAQHQRDQPR